MTHSLVVACRARSTAVRAGAERTLSRPGGAAREQAPRRSVVRTRSGQRIRATSLRSLSGPASTVGGTPDGGRVAPGDARDPTCSRAAGAADDPADHPAHRRGSCGRRARRAGRRVAGALLGGRRRPALRTGLPAGLPADRQPARRGGPHAGGLRPGVPLAVVLHAGHLRGLAAPDHHEPVPRPGPSQGQDPLRRAVRRRGDQDPQPRRAPDTR